MGSGFWFLLVFLLLVLASYIIPDLLGWLFEKLLGERGRMGDFIFFAKKGDANKVRKLLARNPSRHYVDDKGEDGMTPLMYAAREGHADMVQILLDEGADVNKVCGKKTALTMAEENGHSDVIDLLKEAAKKSEGVTRFLDT